MSAALQRALRWIGGALTSSGLVSVIAPTMAQSWWESHKNGYWYVAAAPLLAALSKLARDKWPEVKLIQWLPF